MNRSFLLITGLSMFLASGIALVPRQALAQYEDHGEQGDPENQAHGDNVQENPVRDYGDYNRFEPADRARIRDFFQNPDNGFQGEFRQYAVGDFIDENAWEPVPPQLAAQMAPPPYGTTYILSHGNILVISLGGHRVMDALPIAM